MDRRQRKTREAIFSALSELLETYRYELITVQMIIDEADIGRSTFYAHFDTKDDLLRSLCLDIFHHVFYEILPKETEKIDRENLELKLGHILFHLKKSTQNLKGILQSESGDQFMRYFKEHLEELFKRYTSVFPSDVPEDFLLHHLIGSFSETVKWWISEGMKHKPEKVASYFMKLI